MHNYFIKNLSQNKFVFEKLLAGRTIEEYTYRQSENKWCLLEILCHLYDEELKDFRTRVKHVMEFPGSNPPSIDPVSWVKERKYMEQDYNEVLNKFLIERDKSVNWLQSLKSPEWKNSFEHETLGTLTSEHFLFNWLGHDYLHFRQITHLLFNLAQQKTGNNLNYAGNW